jgi:hypothetical protein
MMSRCCILFLVEILNSTYVYLVVGLIDSDGDIVSKNSSNFLDGFLRRLREADWSQYWPLERARTV